MTSAYHPRTRALLADAGLAPVELEALDHPPRHAPPPFGKLGYGLVGRPGTGKSWTLAQYVAGKVDAAVRSQRDPARAELLWVDGDVARDMRLAWVNWHDEVEDLHRRRFDDAWVDRRASWWERVPMLVLDDLGRERVEGAKDPARAVLQRVLDHRYRQRLALLWTSNLDTQAALEAFYGEALVSRLVGTWPPAEAEGQDMRLFPVVDLKAAAGGER
jgi:DNA replication protein DnaC